MENKESTSGYVEDLVRSFVQLSALELHAKTAYEKKQHEVATSDAQDINSVIDSYEKADNRLTEITELRREVMRIISSFATTLDPERWCEVKHSAMAMITLFEVYQANPTNEIQSAYIKANNLFISIMADFLGFEILPCAACFSDALKGVTTNE